LTGSFLALLFLGSFLTLSFLTVSFLTLYFSYDRTSYFSYDGISYFLTEFFFTLTFADVGFSTILTGEISLTAGEVF